MKKRRTQEEKPSVEEKGAPFACRPGRACLVCPFPDCRNTKGARSEVVTAEERKMLRAGKLPQPS